MAKGDELFYFYFTEGNSIKHRDPGRLVHYCRAKGLKQAENNVRQKGFDPDKLAIHISHQGLLEFE